MEYIRQLLVAKYGEAMVYKGGLKVFTTLNMEMQRLLNGPLRSVCVNWTSAKDGVAHSERSIRLRRPRPLSRR